MTAARVHSSSARQSFSRTHYKRATATFSTQLIDLIKEKVCCLVNHFSNLTLNKWRLNYWAAKLYRDFYYWFCLCKKVFCFRNEREMDLCFFFWDTTSFASRFKPVYNLIEIGCTRELLEASKLLELDTQSRRDTTHWKLASFESVCLKSSKRCTRTINENSSFHNLFFRLKIVASELFYFNYCQYSVKS